MSLSLLRCASTRFLAVDETSKSTYFKLLAWKVFHLGNFSIFKIFRLPGVSSLRVSSVLKNRNQKLNV